MGKTPIVILWGLALMTCYYAWGVYGRDIAFCIAVSYISLGVAALGNYFYFYQKRWCIEDSINS